MCRAVCADNINDLVARRRSVGRAGYAELQLDIDCNRINALERHDGLGLLNNEPAILQCRHQICFNGGWLSVGCDADGQYDEVRFIRSRQVGETEFGECAVGENNNIMCRRQDLCRAPVVLDDASLCAVA